MIHLRIIFGVWIHTEHEAQRLPFQHATEEIGLIQGKLEVSVTDLHQVLWKIQVPGSFSSLMQAPDQFVGGKLCYLIV